MLTIKIKSFAQYNMEFTQLWRKGNSNLTKMLKPASIKAFSHLVLTKMSFLLNWLLKWRLLKCSITMH